VSERVQTDPPRDARASAGADEEIDVLPVLAGGPQLVHARPFPRALPGERRGASAIIPAVQAAAVAAGGFVAGVAVVGLVHRRQRRSAALASGRRIGGDRRSRSRRGGRRGGRTGERVQIVGSRSLLLDVHLLGGSDDR